jgi:hypothetical protein
MVKMKNYMNWFLLFSQKKNLAGNVWRLRLFIMDSFYSYICFCAEKLYSIYVTVKQARVLQCQTPTLTLDNFDLELKIA